MMTYERKPQRDADDAAPPPNFVYSAKHGETIRFHAARGMSRRMLERIYGHVAVHQVLGTA